MKKDPTEFRDRFARWKAGEKVYENGLPAYGGGKPGSKRRYDYKYVQAGKDNGWERITDDEMSDVFQDFVARPKSRGGNTDTYNWNKQWALKGEPGLEIVSPEFDILTLGAGARINAATQAFQKSRKIANAIAKGIKENPIITAYNRNPVTKELGTKILNIGSKQNASNTPIISWQRAQKPLSASEVFPNQTGEGWLKQTADRLGININHYYNNIITPEELAQSIKTAGFESFVPKTVYTEPAYLPSGFPYGLDKSRIFMPYDAIRKMPMMAKYANLPEAEFRKIADNLIGSHEFIHWWNRQLAKNIRSGRMNVPKGYQKHELIWNGQNMPDGMDENVLGKMVDYMTQSNGTESNARLGQLFNAFGIKKGQLTSQHINLAKEFYRKVFPDNQMQLFLNSIKDKDQFVKFANDNAGTLFGLTPAATLAIPQVTNTQNELRNK